MMSNWKFFIARRIYRSREGEKEVSKPAVRIAMAGIAIGLAVMIVSVAVRKRKQLPTYWYRLPTCAMP
jgi:lipoprotein-releasing system permease protein